MAIAFFSRPRHVAVLGLHGPLALFPCSAVRPGWARPTLPPVSQPIGRQLRPAACGACGRARSRGLRRRGGVVVHKGGISQGHRAPPGTASAAPAPEAYCSPRCPAERGGALKPVHQRGLGPRQPGRQGRQGTAATASGKGRGPCSLQAAVPGREQLITVIILPSEDNGKNSLPISPQQNFNQVKKNLFNSIYSFNVKEMETKGFMKNRPTHEDG